MRKHGLAVFFTAVAAASASAISAQQAEETFTDSIEVVEVLLDVIVTDKAGSVILGLDTDDFIVKEEGTPVEVDAATFYSNRLVVEDAVARGTLSEVEGDVPVDRYFILLFHDDPGSGSLVTRERQRAARRAKEWAKTSLLPPNDYVAILRYTKKLLVQQDFTSDVQEILDALDEVAKGTDPGGNWPSRIEEEQGASLRRHLPQGKELRKKTPRIYEALQVVAEAAGSVVGRKNLVLFSIGFGEVDNSGFLVPDRRFYPATYQTLNDNNVAVYGISMLQATNVRGPLGASYDSALTALANDTGGRHFRNFVNYETPLTEVVGDNRGYYLLSYRSEIPEKGSRYRKVDVETRNPEFTVRARRGYLPKK